MPQVDGEGRLVSPAPSTPRNDDDNEPVSSPAADKKTDENKTDAQQTEGALPPQLEDMLRGITTHLAKFATHPPHTIQRLSELLLRPRAHYKSLTPYLHAVDRVAMVTSGSDTYPLPPPDLPTNGASNESEDDDPADAVAWSNPTSASLGTDEALGGALLTPIPWLASSSSSRAGAASSNSPDASSASPTTSDAAATSASAADSDDAAAGEADDRPGAQIHSESTEKIDGPNGMGSVETVSVSVNGVPSTGRARGVTQGELLRQEQRAGVVPVNQLPRAHDTRAQQQARQQQQQQQEATPEEDEEGTAKEEDEADDKEAAADKEEDTPGDEEDEEPHARGPEEIGVGDTGLQTATTSQLGQDGGLETQAIDVEAAVGRKHEDEPAAAAGVKREASVDAEEDEDKPADEEPASKQQKVEGDVDMEG